MIFVVSAAHTYDFAHLEASIPIGLAAGLHATGRDVEVAWGGPVREIDGIVHRRYDQAVPGADDVIVVANPNLFPLPARSLVGAATPEILRHLLAAGRKALFTSCDHPDKDFSMFGAILVEGPSGALTRKYPGAQVVPCLMGAPEAIAIGASPYDKPTVLFCGRIANYPPAHSVNLDVIFRLAQLLPEFDFALLSNYLTLPRSTGSELTEGRAVFVYPVDVIPTEARFSAVDTTVRHVALTNEEAILEVNASFRKYAASRGIDAINLRYCGVKVWGTFWEWYHYAWCCLDFGFDTFDTLAPNTKIIDPLRAGSRVVASGGSCSYYLFDRYKRGHLVPYSPDPGNIAESMARVIRALPPEADEERLLHAEAYRASEGWNARMQFVVDQLKGWL